jgi:hypothetical protein
MTISVSKVDDIIPPIMGTTIRWTGVSIRYAATRMGFQCVRLIFIRYEKARCSG